MRKKVTAFDKAVSLASAGTTSKRCELPLFLATLGEPYAVGNLSISESLNIQFQQDWLKIAAL